MPSSFSSRSNRIAVSRAACAAEALERSTGTCPTPVKNTLLTHPSSPGAMKYSRFARNVIRRGTSRGSRKESATARWLLARIAPPCAGMWCSPSIVGRVSTRISGPSSTYFDHQYSTGPGTPHVDPTSLRTSFPQPQRPTPRDGRRARLHGVGTTCENAAGELVPGQGEAGVNRGPDDAPDPDPTADPFEAIVASWRREGAGPSWAGGERPPVEPPQTPPTPAAPVRPAPPSPPRHPRPRSAGPPFLPQPGPTPTGWTTSSRRSRRRYRGSGRRR